MRKILGVTLVVLVLSACSGPAADAGPEEEGSPPAKVRLKDRDRVLAEEASVEPVIEDEAQADSAAAEDSLPQ